MFAGRTFSHCSSFVSILTKSVLSYYLRMTGKKKPFESRKGEVGEEDRHVSQQPYKYGDKLYNMRALNNIPYHRLKAEQVDLLKEQCLTNIDFLRHKLEAFQLM